MCQYELTDFEWKVIEPLLPNQAARGSAGRRSAGLERHLLGSAHRRALAGAAQRIRPPHDLLQPLCAVARGRGLGSHFGCCDRSLRRRHSDDRQHVGARSSACGELKKSHPDRCMGRSRGGLTTKIHALTDAQGLPLELVLSPGQAGDCPLAGQLLGHLKEGSILLADKAYDADWLRRQIEATALRPTFLQSCIANGKPASARCFTGSATASNASSTGSNISGASPRVTKSTLQTISPCSNWPQPKFGCAIMSPWPRS